MKTWIWILGAVYISLLVFASLKSFKKNRTIEDFMFAGSNIGLMLGVLTYAAALFSTFTFLGMPDFFRMHGVGAWIFLALSDGVMVFFLVWFAFHVRKKAKNLGFRGVAGMISKTYGIKYAGYVIFLTSFLFLIPYAGIQIQGIAIFMKAAFPGSLPAWAWAAAIVAVMLIYSEIGGLKAIIFSDAVQALLLLTVLWIIGGICLHHFGGIRSMFEGIKAVDEKLLSTPGPNGLLTPQFLIASMIAIVMIPVTQPQMTTRIIVMKNLKATHYMAVSLGVFAILIILPTLFIGMYGAVQYPGATKDEFFANAFLYDQPGMIAALAVIGLIAAGLSTTNAQIFALGSELRGLLKGDEKKVFRITRIGIFVFSMIVLLFSLLVIDEIVMLARVSFAGTALMGPMILLGILSKRKVPWIIIPASFIALVIFILSLARIIPDVYFGLRLDLLLFIILGVIAGGSYLLTLSVKDQS
jgi:SSS family solute:Na+ symporter